jgi:HK97 family phage portal protein
MQILTNMAAFPVEAVGYALMMGKIVNFTRPEILHDKFFNPDWDANGMQLYGLSPLQAAAKVLTRSNQGKEYAVSAYQNGGPPGVLFVKKDQGFNGVDLTAQVDLVKERLKQYEGSKNANKIPVSGFEIGYQQIGLSPVDMDILDAEIFDMRAICNIYGVPSQLLNDPNNKTYNNQAEGEKALTTRCALPLLTALRDNFNRKLKNDWNAGSDTVIDFDLSVYSELEGNKLEQVNWLEKSLLPLYRRYEILGESVPEWMDEATRNTILVPSGYQPLEETLMPVPDLQNPYNAQA